MISCPFVCAYQNRLHVHAQCTVNWYQIIVYTYFYICFQDLWMVLSDCSAWVIFCFSFCFSLCFFNLLAWWFNVFRLSNLSKLKIENEHLQPFLLFLVVTRMLSGLLKWKLGHGCYTFKKDSLHIQSCSLNTMKIAHLLTTLSLLDVNGNSLWINSYKLRMQPALLAISTIEVLVHF